MQQYAVRFISLLSQY